MRNKETKKRDLRQSPRPSNGNGERLPGTRLRTDRNGLEGARYYDTPERPPVAGFYHAPKTALRFTPETGNDDTPDPESQLYQGPSETARRKAFGRKRRKGWLLTLIIVLALVAAGVFVWFRGDALLAQWPDLFPAPLSGAETAIPIPVVSAHPSPMPPAQGTTLPAMLPDTTGTPLPTEIATEIPPRDTATPAPTAQPSVSPSATTTPVYDTLRAGDEGDAVTALQSRLIELGYLKEEQLDGSYGDITRRAVRAFQRTHQLEVDGVAGPQTQQRLFADDALPSTGE